MRAAGHPGGRSLYLVHEGVNALTHWVVDPLTGLAEPRATVGTLSSPLALAVAPTGKYLVVPNEQGRAVLFTLDELGEPRFAGTQTVGASPRGILLPPGVR